MPKVKFQSNIELVLQQLDKNCPLVHHKVLILSTQPTGK